MIYTQLTSEDRYTIAVYLKQRKSQAFVARSIGRSPSSISRELKINRRTDGKYCAARAIKRTSRIRRESRRKWHFGDI